MNPVEIRDAIHAKGFTMVLIGETLGVTVNSVSAVVNRRITSKRTAGAIAKIIGKPVTEVFPDVETYRRPADRQAAKAAAKQRLAELLAS